MIDDELRSILEAMQHDIVAGLRQEIQQEAVETRRHIAVAYEATQRQILLLAEGIGSVGEQLGRTEARLDQKIDESAEQTRTLIIFSHEQLDGRLRAIEQRG